MPTYEMKCLKCNLEFETLCKIKERKEVRCPNCKGRTKILMSPPKRDWFRPHWNENLLTYVRSKEHFKQVCLEQNVTSRALGDIRNIKEI